MGKFAKLFFFKCYVKMLKESLSTNTIIFVECVVVFSVQTAKLEMMTMNKAPGNGLFSLMCPI